jgi:hypothetical protein
MPAQAVHIRSPVLLFFMVVRLFPLDEAQLAQTGSLVA